MTYSKMKEEELLGKLFKKWRGKTPANIEPLPISGSARQYYRIYDSSKTFVGCFNKNKKENKAFFTYSKHFLQQRLPVPEIYITDPGNHIYIQEDLGDDTLFSIITKQPGSEANNEEIKKIYKQVLTELIRFQTVGHKELDYSVAYPRKIFDRQSMLWDLNYFKHYFIKLAGVSFHEQELEDDFQGLIRFLSSADSHYFLYRDFQSRNIMLKEGRLYFIDFQGGRMGALQYDPASLLFDAKANLNPETRNELLDHYLSELEKIDPAAAGSFMEYYYGFVLVRMMQAFGAFGYRGFFERKPHFLQSIPFAVKNLKWILDNGLIPIPLPALSGIFEKIVASPNLKDFDYKPSDRLTVLINSFSYKRNIPFDNSGNGGGFVFDCRFLPNPGRFPTYKNYTGQDQEVSAYLESFPEVSKFMTYVNAILFSAVENYQARKFHHLMVSFGCTGGQHRSVYFAEKAFFLLKQKFPGIRIKLRHIEMELNPVKKPEK